MAQKFDAKLILLSAAHDSRAPVTASGQEEVQWATNPDALLRGEMLHRTEREHAGRHICARPFRKSCGSRVVSTLPSCPPCWPEPTGWSGSTYRCGTSRPSRH